MGRLVGAFTRVAMVWYGWPSYRGPVMDADIVKRMRAEEADLVRKLQAVRDFLSAYGEAPREAATGRVVASAESGARPKVSIDSFTAQTRPSVVLAMKALMSTHGLMKTSELVQAIEAMGHTVNGDNKVNALGALLSRSADLIGHGKSGWELADRERALEIVSHYAPKENEAPPAMLVRASEADGEGGRTPDPSSVNPPPWHRA